MATEANVQSIPLSFAERLASSDSFKSLFRDGMRLVEETAAYLDGPGRDDAKGLPRMAALTYASESMRLTTRLMQVASWLLLQRAVNEGEISQADASKDKKKTCVAWQDSPSSETALADMPAGLRVLVETSLRIQDRIIHLDKMITSPEPAGGDALAHPLEGQLSLLRASFCG